MYAVLVVHRSKPRFVASVRSLVLGAALASGVAVGCLDELPRGRSCGDGWWDPQYEACDWSSDNRSYVAACRDQGWVIDATCNDQCELVASEQDCAKCGDGVASGTEQCDGDDLRGRACPSGTGVPTCTDQCTLDFDECPRVCGDGIVSGTEECEKGVSCAGDENCGEGQVCYGVFDECVASDGFSPHIDCGYYPSTAIGPTVTGKPYVSGDIESCTNDCLFGRSQCGFCGDGELDDEYFIHPQANVSLPAELCDGGEARAAKLAAYCEPRCVEEPINLDVVLECDFECNDTCTDFAPPDDISPGADESCCLAKGSPCPNTPAPGVPDLPCCSWLENPEWLASKECVDAQSGQLPQVCP
jgi:hypothetical protein